MSSTSSNPNNRLIWLWVLLGIVGGTSCIGLTGYVFLRRPKKDGDSSSLELGDKKPPPESKKIEDRNIDGDSSNSGVGYANVPRDAAGKIGYANIPEGVALGKDYANHPKGRRDSDYANRPQREKMGSDYANRPKRADRESQYANVASDESESSETDVVPGEV